MPDSVLESQRALPHKLTNMGFRFAFPDAEDALRMLFL
jgi:NAD dependent epimerase/dehydratase family enzyme